MNKLLLLKGEIYGVTIVFASAAFGSKFEDEWPTSYNWSWEIFFNAADRTNSLKCAGQNCKSVSVYRLRNMGAVCRQVCGPKAVDSSEILTHNLHNTYMLEGRGSYQRSHLLFWLPEDS